MERMSGVLSAVIQFVPATSPQRKKHSKPPDIKCPKYLCDKRRTGGFEVLVPTQMNLEPSLPTEAGPHPNYLCFSEHPIKIFKFCEKFQTMQSQAHPKKISLIGNDGVTYSFLI